MANLTQDQLRQLAQLGAKARLEELRQEEAAIRAEFPELFRRGRQRAGNGTPPRRRMTAANRKAVSERMQKYWAEQRKAKAGK
jgi:hypothetical protein